MILRIADRIDIRERNNQIKMNNTNGVDAQNKVDNTDAMAARNYGNNIIINRQRNYLHVNTDTDYVNYKPGGG